MSCKCKYCEKWIDLSDIVNVGRDPISGSALYNSVWKCESCHTHFQYDEDELSMIVFHVKIREQNYMWTCMVKHNSSMISSVSKILQTFDFIPDITPKTVAAKLKTYLTFL